MSKFLTKKEIERYQEKLNQKYRRYKNISSYKANIFADYINKEKFDNDDKDKRISEFEKVYKLAVRTARNKHGKMKKGETLEKDIRNILNEYTNSEKSVLENLMQNNNLVIKKTDIENAEIDVYKDRINNFLTKYGTRTYTYNGETKTLNEWFDDYSNKLLDTKDFKHNTKIMNEIIDGFEDLNPDYDSTVYVGKYRKPSKRRKKSSRWK